MTTHAFAPESTGGALRPILVTDERGQSWTLLWNRPTNTFLIPLRVNTIWGDTATGAEISAFIAAARAITEVVSITVTSEESPHKPSRAVVASVAAAGWPAEIADAATRSASSHTAARGRWITVTTRPTGAGGLNFDAAARSVAAIAAQLKPALTACGLEAIDADDADLIDFLEMAGRTDRSAPTTPAQENN